MSLGLGFNSISLSILGRGGGNATQKVANFLINGSNVVLAIFGDSRTAQKGTIRFEEVLLQAASDISWGGCRQQVQDVNRSGRYTIGSPGLILGDSVTPCSGSLAGSNVQDYFPGDLMRWVDTQAADPAGYWFAYYVDKWKKSKLPLLWDRADLLGSTNATVHWPVVGVTNPSPGLQAGWAVDRFTIAGQVFSTPYDLLEGEYKVLKKSISDMDYSLETNRCPTLVHENGIMEVGTIAFESPIVTACDGVRVISLSVPGRSIVGWNNENILSDWHLSYQIPNLTSALDSTICIPWISLGANYPSDILNAATFNERVLLHKNYLSEFVSRWRSQTGFYLVALDTSYIDAAQKDLEDSYFAVACREFARENGGVALFDTSAAMGSWYDMQAAGLLEVDGIHLNDAGRLVLSQKINDLVIASL